MDCAALFTDIKNFGFSDFSNADLFTHLNYAYQDLNSIESWPYLEKTTTTNFAVGSPQFAAITDIKQILSIINTVQGYELVPMKPDDFYKQYSNVLTLTGIPLIYYQPQVNAAAPMGWQTNVWPVSSVTTACQLRYLYIPATLVNTTDIPVLPERFHRILTYGSLVSLYQLEDDTDSSIRFQGLYDRMLARMRDDLWTKQFDLNDTILDVTNDADFSAYY